MSCFVILSLKSSIACNVLASTVRKHRNCRNIANQALYVVKADEVRRFIEDSLETVGAPKSEAKAHADMMMYADMMGHRNHGLSRLVVLINDCKIGVCCPKATPEILKQYFATAWVDGHNALGATVGNFCMKIALQKAKECGIGWVSVKNSNSFGMAGYWALQAEREGLIGVSLSNSPPTMPESENSALGLSPIAIAAPACDGQKLMVDTAITADAVVHVKDDVAPLPQCSNATVTENKVKEVKQVKSPKDKPTPTVWALGLSKKSSTEPKRANQTGPVMDEENTTSYSAYELASILETFCSGLSGSDSPLLSDSNREEGPPNLGQCYAAIDPKCFSPNFKERVSDCLSTWSTMYPVDPLLQVLAPGSREHQAGKETQTREAVIYPDHEIETLDYLAKKLGVKPIQTKLKVRSDHALKWWS